MAWLTPDEPSEYCEFCILIPNSLGEALSGAIAQLGYEDNWEAFGSYPIASVVQDAIKALLTAETVCLIPIVDDVGFYLVDDLGRYITP